MFKSLDALFHIGVGVEVRDGKETLVIENRNYFFNSTPIYNMGDVGKFELKIYKDWNFKRVKTGFPDKDLSDDTYNDLEFNTESHFETQNETTSEEYDIISKYRADGRAIQQILDNSDGVAWEEDGADNDIFFVQIRNVVTGGLSDVCDLSQGWARKTGEGAQSAWNCGISPRRNIFRHRGFIDSTMYGMSGKFVNFTSGKKNLQVMETHAFTRVHIGCLFVQQFLCDL